MHLMDCCPSDALQIFFTLMSLNIKIDVYKSSTHSFRTCTAVEPKGSWSVSVFVKKADDVGSQRNMKHISISLFFPFHIRDSELLVSIPFFKTTETTT